MILDTIRRWFGGGGTGEDPRDAPEVGCPEGAASAEAGALTCSEALEWIYEYMDGELPEADAANVDRHFRKCQACYPHLKLEEGFRARLQAAAGRGGVPDEVRSRVMELLAREEAGGG